LYFCETGTYEQIDWRDYLEDMGQNLYVIGPDEGANYDECQVGMILDFSWGGYVTSVEGSYDGQSDDGPRTMSHYIFNSPLGSNRFILQLSVNYNCVEEFVNSIIDPS